MDAYDIRVLEQHFGIPGEVSFAEGPNRMPVVEISNACGMGAIALQGAHLLSWAPHGQERVVWLSSRAKFAPGQSVRGGIPVCWPWFGSLPEQPSFPAHGFARTSPWQVLGAESLDGGATRLAFRLPLEACAQPFWPYQSPVEIRHTLGKALEIELRTRNDDRSELWLGEALHTYFQVGDVRRIAVHGLEGCDYLDKTQGGGRKRQVGPVTFDGETDRIYLDAGANCVIEDPVLQRRIRIEQRGSANTVVWNPWEAKARRLGDMAEDDYCHMVCVESANAADNRVPLRPGEEHRLWVRYSVESWP